MKHIFFADLLKPCNDFMTTLEGPNPSEVYALGNGTIGDYDDDPNLGLTPTPRRRDDCKRSLYE